MKFFPLVFLFLVFAGVRSFAQNLGMDTIRNQYLPFVGCVPLEKLNPDEKFVVRDVLVMGNRTTKLKVILREIPFLTGGTYTLQNLASLFQLAQNQLMNTTLFHEVQIYVCKLDNEHLDITVYVRERWYIFPVLYFKPVDRNINQWIGEEGADLSRVNYGIKLLYNNVWGLNDRLRLWLIAGYATQVDFAYFKPYISKDLKWGFNAQLSLGKTREIVSRTENNKQVFFKSDNPLRNYFSVKGEIVYRPKIFTRHRFGVGYTSEKVSDAVLADNPNFFGKDRKFIHIPEISYVQTYYNLDYIPYAQQGFAYELEFSKKGFNRLTNTWELATKATKYLPLNKNWFVTLNAAGSIRLPFKQPYYFQKMMGYGNLQLQGYEFYVVDGVAALAGKASLTRKLFATQLKFKKGGKLIPPTIPFKFYGKIFGNTGYVHSENRGTNLLANKVLLSGGIGLDIVSFYDFTFRIEWAFNHLGENGLSLRRNSIF